MKLKKNTPKTLLNCIDSFIFHCQYEKNLSPKSIKSYKIDLQQFSIFLGKNKVDKNIETLDKNAIRNYLQSISNTKPKTIKRKMATLKAMFNYLEFESLIVSSPFRKLKINIKETKELPKVMSIEEVKKILHIAFTDLKKVKDKLSYEYKEKVRNIAIIELLFATGARVSEIAKISAVDIDFTTWTIKLMGKGRKERMIQICEQEIQEILKEYYQLFMPAININGYFFINKFNNPLSEQSIRFLIKNLSKRVGIERNITPHVFRHTFATLLLEQDVDIKYIQHLLGHSSILTTQIYTHVNKHKQLEILNTKHPRKSFRMLDL